MTEKWKCDECSFINIISDENLKNKSIRDLPLICCRCGLWNSYELAFPSIDACRVYIQRTNYPLRFEGESIDRLQWIDNRGNKLTRLQFLEKYKRDPQIYWGYHIEQLRLREEWEKERQKEKERRDKERSEKEMSWRIF
jgi:hypothetical protein